MLISKRTASVIVKNFERFIMFDFEESFTKLVSVYEYDQTTSLPLLLFRFLRFVFAAFFFLILHKSKASLPTGKRKNKNKMCFLQIVSFAFTFGLQNILL